jgi:hypothetical protein
MLATLSTLEAADSTTATKPDAAKMPPVADAARYETALQTAQPDAGHYRRHSRRPYLDRCFLFFLELTPMKYKFFQDPGHGWIEVPIAELRRLNVADQISPYSYRNGHMAYLEEDCDASAWAKAKRAAGEEFDIIELHTNKDSIVRTFKAYQ